MNRLLVLIYFLDASCSVDVPSRTDVAPLHPQNRRDDNTRKRQKKEKRKKEEKQSYGGKTWKEKGKMGGDMSEYNIHVWLSACPVHHGTVFNVVALVYPTTIGIILMLAKGRDR